MDAKYCPCYQQKDFDRMTSIASSGVELVVKGWRKNRVSVAGNDKDRGVKIYDKEIRPKWKNSAPTTRFYCGYYFDDASYRKGREEARRLPEDHKITAAEFLRNEIEIEEFVNHLIFSTNINYCILPHLEAKPELVKLALNRHPKLLTLVGKELNKEYWFGLRNPYQKNKDDWNLLEEPVSVRNYSIITPIVDACLDSEGHLDCVLLSKLQENALIYQEVFAKVLGQTVLKDDEEKNCRALNFANELGDPDFWKGYFEKEASKDGWVFVNEEQASDNK